MLLAVHWEMGEGRSILSTIFNGRSFPQLHQQQLCEMTGVTEQRRRSLWPKPAVKADQVFRPERRRKKSVSGRLQNKGVTTMSWNGYRRHQLLPSMWMKQGTTKICLKEQLESAANINKIKYQGLNTVAASTAFLPSPFYLIIVYSLSHVQLFATPWPAAHQASLSLTNCQS